MAGGQIVYNPKVAIQNGCRMNPQLVSEARSLYETLRQGLLTGDFPDLTRARRNVKRGVGAQGVQLYAPDWRAS